MAEDRGAQQSGQLSMAWKIVQKKGVAKERGAQRVPNWTRQNVMRGVLGRMTASAA